MSSVSRSLQEQIEKLENLPAPYLDQLLKAVNFVGASLDEDDGNVVTIKKEEGNHHVLVPYKREEWLLIWLLKKMKAEQTARMTPLSWWLLSYLIENLPVPTAAKILIDKEAIVEDNRSGHTKTSMLYQTLRETQEIETLTMRSVNSSSSQIDKFHRDSGKKRKRSDQPQPFHMHKFKPHQLLGAISRFLNYIVKAGSMITHTSSNAFGVSLSAACIKSAYTTSAEKSAEILGTWISLCGKIVPLTNHTTNCDFESWLFPFVELWDSRVPSDTAHSSFSLHCARPVLSLIRTLKKKQSNSVWLPELECLLARNLVIPVKAAYIRKSNLDLLESTVKSSVVLDVSNASILFEIFLRTFLPYKNRRRPDDDALLTVVLKTLKVTMPFSMDSKNLDFMWNMLQLCIDNQFKPDLELLRSITSEISSMKLCESWKLFAAVIVLDSNVFLIPDEEDRLSKLLELITDACFDSSWSNISEDVISQVLVPLIVEFSKARDLSGFLKHWFYQLKIYELRRHEIASSDMTSFGAWDNNMLNTKLREFLEPCLSISQIDQIIKWLDEKFDDSPDAVCTILQAIAGSVSGKEEVVDLISLRLYHTIFSNNRFTKLNRRCRWRAWKIVTLTLHWVNSVDLDELARLWEAGSNPFLWWPSDSNSLLVICPSDQIIYLDCIEKFKCVCAALESSQRSSLMMYFIKPISLEYLKLFSCDILKNLTLEKQLKLYDELSNSKFDLKMRSIVLSLYTLIKCVFVEYSKTLIHFPELKDRVKQILSVIFELASESFEAPLNHIIERLGLPPNAYSDLWISILRNDDILENKELTDSLIDVMLSKDFLNGPEKNGNKFAVYSLSKVPFDVITKNNRGRIMRSWLFIGDEKEMEPKKQAIIQFASDPPVLALKRKIMEKYPSLYEGLQFTIINTLANILAGGNSSHLEVSLSLLKELVHLTISYALVNPAQSCSKIYLVDAFKIIQKKIKKACVKKKDNLNFAVIAISEAALVEFQKKSVSLNEMGIISEDELENVSSSFKEVILTQFKKILLGQKEEDLQRETNWHVQKLYIKQSINTLTKLGVSKSEISDLKVEAQILNKLDPDTSNFLTNFLEREKNKRFPKLQWNGNVTISNRNLIKKITEAGLRGRKNVKKLKMLYALLATDDQYSDIPDKLLAIRHIIMSIDVGIKSSSNDSDGLEIPGSVEDDFDLTKAYLLLNTKLRGASAILPFCIICETLELMLKSKEVDSTLGTISILCSPKSPMLPANNAGTIYLHLTQLLQAILMHHRIKLKGHFPLVQFSMQGLLRCLFQPSLYGGNRTRQPTDAEFSLTPTWLLSQNHQLGTRHAESYARLLMLISDPATSSVPGAKHNNLTSAIEKWKRMSLLFMRFVLMDYIKWQLELSILPDVKEKLMPGWYAVLDTTTLETRMLISAELNANSRAIFSSLYSDYQKFGKWKGS